MDVVDPEPFLGLNNNELELILSLSVSLQHFGSAGMEEIRAAVEPVDRIVSPEPLPGPGHDICNDS